MKELKQEFDKICQKYIDVFCKKQDLNFSYWAADYVGEVAVFNEHYHFVFYDIRHDIDTNQPKGAITDWYDSQTSENYMNYFTYTKTKTIN